MKTPIRATGGGRDAVPTDAALSNAEQVDRAENEGMTIRSKKLSTKMDKKLRPAEITTLERRVLAHERILQSLIAHMTETDSRFLDRLKETYNIQIKYREQDYTDTEDFAEEFVRAIEEAVLRQHKKSAAQASEAKRSRIVPPIQETQPITAKPDRFQIRNRNGIWEVKENGHFFGDYIREDQAVNAVLIAKQKR